MRSQAEEIAQLFRRLGSEATSIRMVWTEARRPFVMGGKVNYVLGAKVPVLGPFDLGKGYSGYLALHPKTEATHVVESETGAFVGLSLEEVRADIAEADEEVMKQQIAAARERVKEIELVNPDKFWSKFR